VRVDGTVSGEPNRENKRVLLVIHENDFDLRGSIAGQRPLCVYDN
jgi:hypothetical protein